MALGVYMTTLKDVAARAGVSPSTVSIVVNKKYNIRKISKATREKVEKAVKELNYCQSVAAKQLRSNISPNYMIGIYWASDARAMIMGQLFAGVQRALNKSSLPIDITIKPYKIGHLSEEKNFLTNELYHAVILANMSEKDMSFLADVTPMIPTVLFNRYLPTYSSVTADSNNFVNQICSQLMATNVKRIGVLAMEKPFTAVLERRLKLMDKLNSLGIEVSYTYYCPSKIETRIGNEHINEILSQSSGLPDCLYCDLSSYACDIVKLLPLHGITVPRDVKVITSSLGFSESAYYTDPPITVVEIPVEEISMRCMNLLIKTLKNPDLGIIHEQCEPVLHKRGSI